ncbi:ArsR/SmtB family transcription factor [Jannaschia sp. R86511]|uniref:ArsR/SmtB family transcription factor n=1 Tax=Jannaschia sp. R86511 TaxID=3093853 RepID=UPI0036D36207
MGLRHPTPLVYDLHMRADSSIGPPPAPELVTETVLTFHMLADETRVQLLWALLDAELSVGELAARVGKPAPAVSQHLARLRLARIVGTRRDGTFVYYRLENDHIAQLLVDAFRHAEHGGPGLPPHHDGQGARPAVTDHDLEESTR